MAHHVFISYARKDADFALKLGRDLREEGVPIWLDQLDILPGQRWDRAVEQALESCARLLVILSPDSAASENVLDEVAFAFEQQKPIVPVFYRPCKIPLRLRRLQYIDFAIADYQGALGRLLASLQASSLAKVSEPSQGSSAEEWLRRLPPLAWGGLLALLLLVGLVAIWPRGSGKPTSTPATPTSRVAAQPIPTDTPLAAILATATPKSFTATPPPMASLGDTWIRPTDAMAMVYVPGGAFQMGSTDAEVEDAFQACKAEEGNCQRQWFEAEQPRHTVSLDGFWIDRTEVTNAQYARCVAAGKCSLPSPLSSDSRSSYYGDGQYDDYPVIYVSWDDAANYCAWAGGQLPTEAQWEYAARGSDGRLYPWGNDPPHDTWLNFESMRDTTRVGSYPDGASWGGAFDMAGNVWEWVADWYGPYSSEAQVNPIGPSSGQERVLRGGGWRSGRDFSRVACRDRKEPDSRYDYIGFRCAMSSGK